MVMSLRVVLAGLFITGVAVLRLQRPELFSDPEIILALTGVGVVLLALCLEEIRARALLRRDRALRERGAWTGSSRGSDADDDGYDAYDEDWREDWRDYRPGERRGRSDERVAPSAYGWDEAPQGRRAARGSRMQARTLAERRPRRAGRTRLSREPGAFARRARIALRALAVNLTIWCVMIGCVLVAYANRARIHEQAVITLSAFRPGEPMALSSVEAVLSRDGAGHFTAVAEVNGGLVRMLVDTGSSDVALPFEEAKRLGVDLDALRFTRAVMTANGQAMVAPVVLREVSVGPITLVNVTASVAEPGRLGSPLLGMSFLRRLSEVSIRGDTLRLKS
ncbi:MAG: TIGR02281 family clan AA aspartic protease [Pseudomonadota bacterium]